MVLFIERKRPRSSDSVVDGSECDKEVAASAAAVERPISGDRIDGDIRHP